MKHDKWGWIIYRCTYKDESAWNRFKQSLLAQTEAYMARPEDPPAAAGSHELIFVEDRDSLDGVSINQLRVVFKQWRAQASVVEQPRVQDNLSLYYSQHRYFVQVDEQSLQDLQDWGWDGGSVNFVDADWRSLRERLPTDQLTDDYFAFEPIDGCTEEDVGWMKIAGPMIGEHFYEDMCPDLWYVYYRRPHEILYH